MDRESDYLKVPEVARMLRIARSCAYDLVARGTIPSIRIGRSIRVSHMELERWLTNQVLSGYRTKVNLGVSLMEREAKSGNRRLIEDGLVKVLFETTGGSSIDQIRRFIERGLKEDRTLSW
jgi:excisionase family DNA binding protein